MRKLFAAYPFGNSDQRVPLSLQRGEAYTLMEKVKWAKKALNTPYFHFELNNDLLIASYKKDARYNLEVAKELVKTRLEFTEHKPHLMLIYNQGIRSLDKQARDYLSSDEGGSGIVAAAYVLGNSYSAFFINFFVSITKVKMPVRTFYKKEAALKWLEKHRKQPAL